MARVSLGRLPFPARVWIPRIFWPNRGRLTCVCARGCVRARVLGEAAVEAPVSFLPDPEPKGRCSPRTSDLVPCLQELLEDGVLIL